MYFPEIKKKFVVFSLVLNLLASQIGDFFLPHLYNSVVEVFIHMELFAVYKLSWLPSNNNQTLKYVSQISEKQRHHPLIIPSCIVHIKKCFGSEFSKMKMIIVVR